MRNTTLTLALAALASFVPTLVKADLVTDWNTVATNSIRAVGTHPPLAARNLAILHTAIYDAVNGINPTHRAYVSTTLAPAPTSPEAAVIVAGRDVLLALFPTEATNINNTATAQLATIADSAAKTNGINWGAAKAAEILAARANDGTTAIRTHTADPDAGKWLPTLSFGNIVRPALAPQWGAVRTFALPSAIQVRANAPYNLTSDSYAREFEQVKHYGGSVAGKRSALQTQTANFWAYGPGTSTPPGHWNDILRGIATSKRLTLQRNARLFALVNIAMADAGIAAWESKYYHDLWRPITAIQNADLDGNYATVKDTGWTPLLPTPPFPAHVSGHSTFSAAAAEVLKNYFGTDEVAFTATSEDLPTVTRRYKTFSSAANESGISRVYGGIHFQRDNAEGLRMGKRIGKYVSTYIAAPIPKGFTPLPTPQQ